MFEHDVRRVLAQNKRKLTPISLVLIDIDNFKIINDKYGHLEGDKVLKNIAQLMSDNIRESDFLSRWGGEEFVILLQNCDIESAIELADKIRQKIASYQNFPEQVTVSIGVSEATKADNEDSLLNRADNALYQAKNEGKNCIKKCL